MTLSEQIRDYIAASFAGIWIQTREPDEAELEIRRMADKLRECNHNCHVFSWDMAAGWHHQQGQAAGDPAAPLRAVSQMASPDGSTLVLLHNFHRFLANPLIAQELANKILSGKSSRIFFIILSPMTAIPLELEKLFVLVEHPLPSSQELADIARELSSTSKASAGITDSALGLTRYEAEGAFALSLARHQHIEPTDIWDLKRSIIAKIGCLTMYRGGETLSQLGGLGALKDFCRLALAGIRPGAPRPRGVMLIGTPGTGKSHFAKALGAEVGRPTLCLDIGACYGSLVGQTEERIRAALAVVDAMAPCILFVDEIEKALSGFGGQGDSGVSSRLFGTVLTWLSDHTSNVFVVATSNNISLLPPEFTRAERWDAIYFLDLPTSAERETIWSICKDQHSLNDASRPLDDAGWTGAEIRACCRLAAMLEVPIAEAARYVVPIARTSADQVAALRQWARGRCLSAAHNAVYGDPSLERTASTSRRKLNKETVQ